jgi:hypothetical protein
MSASLLKYIANFFTSRLMEKKNYAVEKGAMLNDKLEP